MMTEKVAKWTLEARGRVQRVGYRDVVEEAARVLRVAGSVENDPEDEELVRIVAQGPPSTLAEFVKAISGKIGFAEAVVQKVGESSPEEALLRFKKIRGRDSTETLERADESVKILRGIAATGLETLTVSKETLAVGKETLAVGKETLTETRKVGQSVERGNQATEMLHKDMTQRFDEMGHAYGIIGKTLVKIDKDLQAQTKALLQVAKEMSRTTRALSRAGQGQRAGRRPSRPRSR